MTEERAAVPSAAPPIFTGAQRLADMKLLMDHVLERIHAELGVLLEQAATQDDATR